MINESHNLFHICFETWCYMTTLNRTVTIPGIESNTNVLSVLFLVAAYSLVLGILLIEKWQSISKSFVISGMFLGTVTLILSNETVYSTHRHRVLLSKGRFKSHISFFFSSLSSLICLLRIPVPTYKGHLPLDVRRKADIMGRNEITLGSYLTSFFHLKSLLHLLHISFLGFDDS